MAIIYHSGYVFKDDGTAVSGATVQLYQTDSDTLVTVIEGGTSVTTDSNGYYTASVTEASATSGYDVKITSGSSLRKRRGNDRLQIEELDIRNDQANTQGGLLVANTTNNASNKVATFAGRNTTGASNDEIYLSFELHNAAEAVEEYARMTVVAKDATADSEDGEIQFDVMKAGTLTKVWTISSSTAGATSMDMDVDSFTIGTGAAGKDITLTFDAETNDGVITWMEDEDYFKFSDEVLMNSTEKILFGDTGTFIHQSSDGVLTITSDTTVDINGAVVFDGAITGATNITLSGELDAATLDISGNADIDGTLEADAITVDGATLAEFVSDTVGAMVTSNTESGITVAYQDADNTLDFTVGTLNQDTTGTAAIATTVTITDNESTNESNAIIFTAGGDVDGGNIGLESDGTLTYNPSTGKITATGFIGALTGNADTATLATTVTITDNESTNENNAIIFTAGGDLDGGNLGLESDGDLYYNPSTGTLTVTNVSVSGTFSTVNSVTMDANNAVIFEGTTADAYETTLTSVDATADRTISLPNVGGTLPVLAAASATQISATPGEINLIDGDTARGTTAVASGDGILINDGGTMRMTNVDTVSTYFASHAVGGGSIVTTGALDSGSITSGFGNIDNGSSTLDTGAITGTTIDASTDFTIGTTVITDDSIVMTPSTSDTVTIAGATNGVLNITTVDNAAAAANLNVTIDGAITLDAAGNIELDSATGIFIFEDGGTEVLRITEGNSGDVTIKTAVNAKDLIFTDNGDATNMKILDAAAGINVPGEVQTTKIAFTDGDDAITVADGGGITAAAGITSTAAANSFGASTFAGDITLGETGTVSIGTPLLPTTDHTSTGLTAEMLAGGGIAAFDLVCIHTTTQEVVEADASAIATTRVIGIAPAAISDTATGTILLQGFIRDDTWTWTTGSPLYLSETAGAMTHTAPTTDGAFVVVVGIALSPDVVYINPSLDIIEHA
mgnify:CR=1 FL=1